MNILVLGASNSSGDHLPNRDDAWPWLLSRALPVSVTHRRFYVTSETYLDYLERELKAYPADVLILFPAAVFAAATAVNAVSERLGSRAGRVAARVRELLQRKALRRTVPFAYGSGRWVARRLFGARSSLPVEEASRRYVAVLDSLGALNARAVIVMSGCTFGDAYRAVNPSALAVTKSFNEGLRARALQRGFVWLDTNEMISAGGTREPLYFEHDVLHFGGEEHALIAAAVRPHLEALL